MKKWISFFTITLYTSLLCGQEFYLTGTVSHQSTAAGIEDVIISVSNHSSTYFTYDEGAFRIPFSQPGSYQISFSKKGFIPYTQTYHLNQNTQISVFLSEEIPFIEQIGRTITTEEVVISATRANKTTPTTFSTIDNNQIQERNVGQDLPYLLENTPSVVVTSDAGHGIGYTSMRIRGSDQSRINVTVNGIPYNDAESQGVFYVDMPDIASSVDNIQIQRGIGTSVNGAGAFGATVNIETFSSKKNPYAEISSAAGSFKTFKNTLNFGTGLIKNKFSIDGRLSSILSDGYIDRATSDLRSYFVAAKYIHNKTIFRFNTFSGKEITYQSWNGIDRVTLDTNRTFNSAGTDFGQKQAPYDREVDDYKQDHYQFFITQQIKNNWNINVAMFYTRGKGFFEQYKVGQSFSSYGLKNVVLGADTISTTDLIRRRWLDNHFYGFTYDVQYKKSNKIHLILGGGWNQYDGDHFGEIIWAQYASNSDIRTRYYENNGLKTDVNTYLKTSIHASEKLILFLDIQHRLVSYSTAGIDNNQRYLFVDDDIHFFNPKAGLTYFIHDRTALYASYAMAGREPTRNDYIDARSGKEPSPEYMHDVEIGLRKQSSKGHFNLNYYFMYYKDQLIVTGELNDVGSLVRTNVDKSYRTGIELDAGFTINRFTFSGNATWSVNQIKSFDEIAPDGSVIQHNNTKIAFSPQWIGSGILSYEPVSGLKLSLVNKAVSRQFLDNTTNVNRSLDSYFIQDIRINYTIETKSIKEIEFTFLLKNITNRKYEANGYVYWGEPYFYPQATIHAMGGIRFLFAGGTTKH